jgi:hypothetical protein
MSDRALSHAKRKVEEQIATLRAQSTDQLLPYEQYASKVGEIAGLKWASKTIDQTIKDYRDDRLGDDR